MSPPDVNVSPDGIFVDEYAKIGNPLVVELTRTRTGVMAMFWTRFIADTGSNVKMSSTTVIFKDDVPDPIPSLAVRSAVLELGPVGMPEKVRLDPTWVAVIPGGRVDDVNDVIDKFALDVAAYMMFGSTESDLPTVHEYVAPGAGVTVTVSTAIIIATVIMPTVPLLFVAISVATVVPEPVGVPVRYPS